MKKIAVINLQKDLTIDCAQMRSFAENAAVATSEAAGRHFTVAFISDERMKQLNELFRGKDTTTDVLSFPHEPDDFDPDKDNIGDIVVSAQQAQKQAVENGLTFDGEIRQLILHGLLHLCGYDHETDDGEMNKRELALRETLGV